MEEIKARILLENLLNRISQSTDGLYQVRGGMTRDEMEAIRFALNLLEEGPPPTTPDERSGEVAVAAEVEEEDLPVEIDFSTLEMPAPPDDRRLCVDFGTAMSKVTLVRDPTSERDYEEIVVLKIGEAGGQDPTVSENMLISSVYIDDQGLLWFGQEAVGRSQKEDARVSNRQRLDNIKLYLSEGSADQVSDRFNPTEMKITYGDMVLAYLMFLTGTVNHCLKAEEEQLNLKRRFALPCFPEGKSAESARILRKMLGEAQILADTFYYTLQDGIPLKRFIQALQQIRESKREYEFIGKSITEPLGVAGSIVDWEPDTKAPSMLLMVIDVGAGTSDFSMFITGVHPKTGERAAFGVKGAAEGITEAGNHLDKLLQEYILNRAGIDSSHENWGNIRGNLALDLRDYKETLFREGEVMVALLTGDSVEIELDDFLGLDQVRKFGDSLRECRDMILERVEAAFIERVWENSLAVALTGGGAELPMVKALAKGKVTAQGKELRVAQTHSFPHWLQEEYDELESDYPRIAVSLGGARKKLIELEGFATTTAGDVKNLPVFDIFYD